MVTRSVPLGTYSGPAPLTPEFVARDCGILACWDHDNHWVEVTHKLSMASLPEYLLHQVRLISAFAADKYHVDLAGAEWALAALPMEQESRPPNVDARNNRGEPMPSGAVVRIDDRNGAEALRLLHEAYHALGRGYNDEGYYGSTYNAIAEFLYPDVIDVEPARCGECGAEVQGRRTSSEPERSSISGAASSVAGYDYWIPCGHLAIPRSIGLPLPCAVEPLVEG